MRIAILTLATLCASAAVAEEAWFLPYEPDEHTVALFHFDGEGDTDVSVAEAEIEATLTGGATRAPGVFAGGVELHGTKECVRLNKSEALMLGNDQPFTIEAWLRPDSADGAFFSLATRYYLRCHYSRGTASFGYRAADFPIHWYPLSGVPWERRAWQHVALTHDEQRQVNLFINGHLVASTEHPDLGDYAEGGGGVFAAHDGWRDFTAGGLDEIRISNTVRRFAPLLTRTAYLPGEQVRLNLDEVTLPEAVATVAVSVTAGGAEVFAGQRPAAEASQPLFAAEDLGDGPARATINFLDDEGATIASVAQPLSFVGAQVTDLAARAEACRATLAGASPDAEQSRVATLLLDASAAAIEGRDVRSATQYMTAAEEVALSLATGEARYRASLRAHVRAGERDDHLRVTMSWGADDAGAALPWAERIGANELVTTSRSATREGLQLWLDAGYHTAMLSSTPIHTAPRDQPEMAQFGYWYMDTAPAADDAVTLKLKAPSWGGLSVSEFFPPAEYWMVLDQATGEKLPPERWYHDHQARSVTVTGAQAGQVFRVYYMIQTGGIGDPLYEPFAQHGLAELASLIAPLEGVLETYWFDDLAYAWPGSVPQGGYDWESYTNAARPENQRAFTEATGIPFDPRWLVMPPRTLEVPPRDEYLAWMNWVQSGVNKWMARATQVVRDHGMRTWLYWGDTHVGTEPFLGGLEAGRVDEVDKPAADPVTARALVDFPGDTYRRLRVDWLHDHVVGQPSASASLRRKWDRCKRGMLMAPPAGMYWMPMPNLTGQTDEAIREAGVTTLADISDEFRLIGRNLSGQRAYEGGLNLYVVHSWGKQYSWRPWGSRVLWHLTDLPMRVRFISFREVIADGVPDDAHCLLLYGSAGSAWSGGPIWQDERLAQAIEGFVSGGGGVVGLQAPSHVEDPEPRWALADVFGITGEGAAGYDPAVGVSLSGDEAVDEEALAAAAAESGLSLVAVADAWPGPPAPSFVPGMAGTVRASAVADGVNVAYALRDDEGMSPGAVTREVGEGRAAWLCGYSMDYGFSRLVRSAVFWAAGREAEADRLDVTGGEELFVYAYPEARIVALLSASADSCEATVRCAPEILGLPEDARCRVTDIATGEVLAEAADLAQGLTVTAVPHCTRLLRVSAE
jgi:1,3-beta-galactosyl-N-acetylhexosamine phosphorylase